MNFSWVELLCNQGLHRHVIYDTIWLLMAHMKPNLFVYRLKVKILGLLKPNSAQKNQIYTQKRII